MPGLSGAIINHQDMYVPKYLIFLRKHLSVGKRNTNVAWLQVLLHHANKLLFSACNKICHVKCIMCPAGLRSPDLQAPA